MDSYIKEWFRDAATEDWCGLGEVYRAAVRVHGELAGLWRCKHCDMPILDPAVAMEAGCLSGEGIMLYGDITLCEDCHAEAVSARRKILVVDDEDLGVCEDVSNLSQDEITLAGYLDTAEHARNRADRDIIHSYPRGERAFLHRLQDRIEADRSRDGKTVD